LIQLWNLFFEDWHFSCFQYLWSFVLWILTVVDISETNNINTSTQSTEHISFSKWEDIKIQCDIVKSKYGVRLKPGQLIINNGKPVGGTPYHFVDTSYRKEYFRTLKSMLSNDEQSKWLWNKMTTVGNQVSLYKCSGTNCKKVFSNRLLFRSHLNNHYDKSSKTCVIVVFYSFA